MRRKFLTALLAGLALAGPVWADEEPDSTMRVWLDADYLLWAIKNFPVSQPLVTTATGLATTANEGALGTSTTRVLAGDDNINQGFFSGYRFSAGWINLPGTFGLEGNFFNLTQHATADSFASGATGSPLLSRPLFERPQPDADGAVGIGPQRLRRFGHDRHLLRAVGRRRQRPVAGAARWQR